MSTPLPPQPRADTALGHSQRIIAALVVVLALLSGVIAGVAIDRGLLLHHRPGRMGPTPGWPPRGPFPRGGFNAPPGPGHDRMERMEQELGLTAAQKTRVDSIMHRRMKERGVLEDSMRNRMRAFFDSTRAEIDSVLTPAQRTQLREKFPPPGPGAPHGERRPGD